MKLKLCFIGDASNVHTQKFVNYFVDAKHDVYLFDNHQYKYKNLKFYLIKSNTGIKFIDYMLRILKTVRSVREIKPDVLHSFQVTYHGFIGALCNVHPFVITPWGSDILYDPEKSYVHKSIIKFSLDKADLVHCIDASIVNRLKYFYGAKINKNLFVLNEGVKTNIFRPRRKNHKYFLILHLRRLNENRGAMFLIEALNILINKKSKRNIRVIMLKTGDKDYKEKINQKIKEYGLDRYIKFFEWINYETPKFFENADVYVDTMHRKVQGQGAGKTLLEAMSSGVPVIAPNNPDVMIYLKHLSNGVIYRGADSESLANSILLLMQNKKLRLSLGKRAREFIVKNLEWGKNMKIMEEKYYALL